MGGEVPRGPVAGSRLRLATLALLALIAAAAYRPALDGPFTFDDLRVIVGNRELSDPGAVARAVPASLVGQSRAVTDLTFALDRAWHGLKPGPFHLGNLALHLATLLLLAWLGGALLRRAGLEAPWLPVAAAGLWGLHPLGSGAVAYVSQRYELLSSAAYVAALALALHAESRPRRWPWQAAATALVLAGLGAKGLTVTAFAALALLLVAFPASDGPPAPRALARRVAPWLLASLAFLAGTLVRLDGNAAAGFSMADLSPGGYWLAQGRVLLAYARLALWPTGQSADHDVAPGSPDATSILAWGAVAGLAVLGIVALRSRRRGGDPALGVAGFGLLWFLLLLAPTSALPIADLMVEHRAYLASWGLVLSVLALGHWALRRAPLTAAWRAVLAAAALAVLLGGATAALVVRTRLWGDEVALWRDAVEQAPQAARPHNNLANALVNAGDREGARREWRRAGQLWPERMQAQALAALDRAEALGSAGRGAEGRALAEQVRERMMPAERVQLRLAEVQLALGEPRAAELTLGWVIGLGAESARAVALLADTYLAEGRIDEAVGAAGEAVALDGRSVAARLSLSAALARAGQTGEACAALAPVLGHALEVLAQARAIGCSF